MTSGIKLYTNIKTKETRLELWGASTKHPDSVFVYNREEESPKPWLNAEDLNKLDEVLIYGWLLKCAGNLTWWFHQRQLADFANEYYEQVLR